MDSEKVKLHEEFVRNLEGTDMSEIIWITLSYHTFTFVAIFIGVLIPKLSHSRQSACVPHPYTKIKKIVIYLKEFFVIVIPLLLSTTVLTDHLLKLVTTVFVCIVFGFVTMKKTARDCKLSSSLVCVDVQSILKMPVHGNKRSFITCCRSMVNLMTVIAILAVDFDIFPRRFAKTETYGFSLMDLGVGLFIMSNAIVVKPEKIISGGFKQTTVGFLLLMALGLSRTYFIQGINYQKNVSEYGIHWNFFYTLAIVKLLFFIIMKFFHTHCFSCAIVLSILHQLSLHLGLEQYVISDRERNDWINANRTGLVSILGYTCLFLLGFSASKFLNKKQSTVGDDLKCIAGLFSVGVLLLVVVSLSRELCPVSRRLVNITYLCWVLSMTLLHFSVAMTVELFTVCFVMPHDCDSHYRSLTPVLFESINFNGMAFFLLANIFTGLVNILFDTITMNVVLSTLVLAAYLMVNCIIVSVLYFRQFKLKFW